MLHGDFDEKCTYYIHDSPVVCLEGANINSKL